MSQVIERYASTLFGLATADKKVAAVEKEAGALFAAFSESDELAGAMKSPLYHTAEKAAVLSAIGKKLKVSTLVQNFVSVVVEHSRAPELPAILKGFLDKAAKARGAVKAEITTASELTKEQLEELKSNLSSAFKAEVEVETSVNPELIGGLVVKVGSQLFDDSIKTKLDGLKNSLKGA